MRAGNMFAVLLPHTFYDHFLLVLLLFSYCFFFKHRLSSISDRKDFSICFKICRALISLVYGSARLFYLNECLI